MTEDLGKPIGGTLVSGKSFTPKMIRKQEQIGESLAVHIVNLLNVHGHRGTAELMGIPQPTLTHWIGKLGIIIQRVATLPNQELRVVEKES